MNSHPSPAPCNLPTQPITSTHPDRAGLLLHGRPRDLNALRGCLSSQYIEATLAQKHDVELGAGTEMVVGVFVK